MSASLDIFFLDSHTLEDVGTLKRVVQVFLDMGFSIDEFEVSKQAMTWEYEPSSMRNLLTLAHQARDCYFLAWNAQWRLEIRQFINWNSPGGEKEAWICTDTLNTPYFKYAEKNPAQYSRFYLDIGKSLYEVLQPTFGWIDFDYGLQTTHEDIWALKLPKLYWANFFGPAYVDRIGRETILGAPAWTIEDLTDGGLLYVLASYPGLAANHVPIENVKAHFGVEQVR